jgi:hypothetical protein
MYVKFKVNKIVKVKSTRKRDFPTNGTGTTGKSQRKK